MAAFLKRLAVRLQPITRPLAQLAARPLTLAALLILPLWVTLSNIVVALAVSLLLAFFIAMLYSLWALRRQRQDKP